MTITGENQYSYHPYSTLLAFELICHFWGTYGSRRSSLTNSFKDFDRVSGLFPNCLKEEGLTRLTNPYRLLIFMDRIHGFLH